MKIQKRHWKDSFSRVFSIALAIMMILVYMPTTAYAEDGIEPAEITEAQVAEEVQEVAEVAEPASEEAVVTEEPAEEVAEEVPSEEVTEADAEEISEEAVTTEETAEATEESDEEVDEASEEDTEDTDDEEDEEDEEEEEEEDEEDEDEEIEETEDVEFSSYQTIDDVLVRVQADAGVFPEGAYLFVRKVTRDERAAVESSLDAVRSNKNVAAAYTFDITVFDKNGNEIQPDTSKGNVYVNFTLKEATVANLTTDVYHTNDELQTEALAYAEQGETIIAQTTGFSFYTVEFTYGDLQYVMQGGTEVTIAEILTAVGLSGSVLNASGSNNELFTVKNESGVWSVQALQAFDTEETLTVDLDDGQRYVITVTDTPGEVGAHSYTNDAGDVFLGGKYIEVGVAKTGSFGTASAASADFHPTSENTTSRKIGLSVDGDGFETGNAASTGDFFLPGSPEERYILAYKIGGTAYNNCNAERNGASWRSPQVSPTTTDHSDLTSGKLKSTTTGTTHEGVAMVMNISFDANDMYYMTEVTITNNSTSNIDSVRWVRSFDPDMDAEMHGDYNTYNKVISNPNSSTPYTSDQCAMVVAKGGTTQESFFFAAFDPRARASRGVSFSPSNAYMDGLWSDSGVPTVPTSALYSGTAGFEKEDNAIAITFDCGTLAPGQSTTLSYYSSLDPNVDNTFSKLSGSVNYVDEAIEGLEANTVYEITAAGDSITYVIQSNGSGQISFTGTDSNGTAYDFVGKTLTIRKQEGTEEPANVEISGRPSAIDAIAGDDATNSSATASSAARPSDVSDTSINAGATYIEFFVDTDDAAKMAQQYALYTTDGTQVATTTWTRPDENGRVRFSGLTAETTYIVKARIPATSSSPASLPTAGVTVSTTQEDLNNFPNGSWTVPTGEETTFTYDGNPHTAPSVTALEGATVTYSASYGSAYSTTVPSYTSAGTYTVYYRIEKEGYRTVYGSYEVTINQNNTYDANNSLTKVELTGKDATDPNQKDSSETTFVTSVSSSNLNAYTQKEAEKVGGATPTTVQLTVNLEKEDDVAAGEVTNIKNVISEKYPNLDSANIKTEYLDMKVLLNNVPQEDLGQVIEIAIDYDTTDKYAFSIIRNHQATGQADVTQRFTPLSERPTSGYKDGTFYVDTANQKIYVYTQLFSTYAVVYSTIPYTIPEDVPSLVPALAASTVTPAVTNTVYVPVATETTKKSPQTGESILTKIRYLFDF